MKYQLIVEKDEVSEKLFITLPPELIKELNWKDDQSVTYQLLEDGRIVVSKVEDNE